MWYCYNSKCPVRTPKEPWPRSDGICKYVKVVSYKTNKPYYRKLYVCKHCGERMMQRSDNFYED